MLNFHRELINIVFLPAWDASHRVQTTTIEVAMTAPARNWWDRCVPSSPTARRTPTTTMMMTTTKLWAADAAAMPLPSTAIPTTPYGRFYMKAVFPLFFKKKHKNKTQSVSSLESGAALQGLLDATSNSTPYSFCTHLRTRHISLDRNESNWRPCKKYEVCCTYRIYNDSCQSSIGRTEEITSNNDSHVISTYLLCSYSPCAATAAISATCISLG